MEYLYAVEVGLMIYFVLSLLWNYSLMMSAARQIKTNYPAVLPQDTPPKWRSFPGISILIPAYNEQDVIVQSVSNLVYGNYPGPLEVCICDDGSTDNTLEYLIDAFNLKKHPEAPIWSNDGLGEGNPVSVVVTKQENGGRAAGLNGAFALAMMPYVLATDADTIIDMKGLMKIVVAMETDKELEACGGSLLLANDLFNPENGEVRARVPRNLVEGVQTIEYLRAFLYGRLGMNKLGGNVCVSGAFGVFRNHTIDEMGGWDETSVAEDMDMTTRIRAAGGKALFIPDPVAWTQAPPDLKSLGHQRSRWHRGLSQIYGRYGAGFRSMFKHGILGKFVLPAHFFVEWLGPLMEAAGLICIAIHVSTHGLSWLALPILVGGYLLNVLLSIISIKFERDNFDRYEGSPKLFLMHAFLEPFWYRPLMIFWRLRGLIEHLVGKKGWGGAIKRKSFATLMMVLLTVLPAKADTWVEGLVANEGGEVRERTDLLFTGHHDAWTMQWIIRDYDDTSVDHQYSLDFHKRLDPTFGFNIGAHVATRGELLPENGYYFAPYVVAGRVVVTPTIHVQNFNPDEQLMLASINIDYYYGNYRFGFRQLVADESEVDATTFSVQHIGDLVVWTLYVSDGNEVLDIPFYFGSNRVAGGIMRLGLTDTFDIILGGNVGERNEQGYITGTAGLRKNF